MSDTAPAPIMIMAGGTGGHIFPGLAVAEDLRARKVPVLWLGASGGMETKLVPARNVALRTVPVSGVRGKNLITRIAAPWMMLRALFVSLRILREENPRCVLSMGGYVAGPGGIAAWLTRKPLLVHEQNRVPGFTNRALAHIAKRVLAGFVDAFPANAHAEWTGNPVRASIATLPPPEQRFAGRGDSMPQLLVLGGSRGARALNLRVPDALALIPEDKRPRVLHQCGADHVEATRAAYARAQVEAEVVPFIEDMAAAYARADLAICRAGALTLAELAAAGLGAILIPFPHAVDDHQTRNAQAFVDIHAAEVVQERDFQMARFATLLQRLLGDRAKLLAMAQAARTLAKPEAAATIAQRCLEADR
ncbi:MAG TPA: undecaprenyldiphospho-muramoylpentapeptide beta-N-acetylglucosaminyltransferase [Rhodanobacteraceae bacterium]|nr:undecaprenyldiphospho-muramoylpentapeptide beta-N-acetylglucosaminyltransferase [Rhodanobacteraceae bacterium]